MAGYILRTFTMTSLKHEQAWYISTIMANSELVLIVSPENKKNVVMHRYT